MNLYIGVTDKRGKGEDVGQTLPKKRRMGETETRRGQEIRTSGN